MLGLALAPCSRPSWSRTRSGRARRRSPRSRSRRSPLVARAARRAPLPRGPGGHRLAGATARRRTCAALRELHRRLEKSFPRLHAALEREVVAGGSLLYRWAGSDPDAAPILLMGHLDVVPVEPGTEARWTHPALRRRRSTSDFVWGRGALDDKMSVLGIAEAVERLLARRASRRDAPSTSPSATTRRSAAREGAGAIAGLLAERGVRLAYTIDEGMGIVARGLVPAVPARRGADRARREGLPHARSGGDARAAATPRPRRTRPRSGACRARSPASRRTRSPRRSAARSRRCSTASPPSPSSACGCVLRNRWLFDPLLRAALRREPAQAAMLHTTTAPTLLRAGVKDNVLPSEARAVVNFRILPGDSVDGVDRARAPRDRRPGPRAARARGARAEPDLGSGLGRATAPSRAPSARSSRAAWSRPPWCSAAPTASTTREVAEQSFRFVPLRLAPEDLKRVHGTDERVAIDGYLDVVRFFVQLLQQRRRGAEDSEPAAPLGRSSTGGSVLAAGPRPAFVVDRVDDAHVGDGVGGAGRERRRPRARRRRRRAAGGCSWRRRARARRGGPARCAPLRRCQSWGAIGLTTRSSPASPTTRALAASSFAEASEHSTRPLRPSGKRSSAAIQRSTRGEAEPRLGAHHLGLGAGEGAHHVDRVAARVHGGAAGEIEAVADVAGQEQRDAEARLDVAHGAELAARDHLEHARGERVVAPVEGLEQHAAGARRRLAHARRLRRRSTRAASRRARACPPRGRARVHAQWCEFGSGL